MQNPNVQSVKLFTPGKPVNSQQGSDGIFISLPPGKKEAGNPVPRPSHLPERLDRFCHSQVESALQAYVHRQMPQLSSQLTALRASQNAEPLIHPALCFPQTRSNRPSRRQKEAGRPGPSFRLPSAAPYRNSSAVKRGLLPAGRRLRRSCRPLGKRAAGVPGDGVVISRAAAPRRSLDRRARVFFQPLITKNGRPAPSCPRKAIPSSWRPRTGRRVPGRICVHTRPAQIAEIVALPHCRTSRLLSPAARSQISGEERPRRPSPGVSGFSSFSVPGASLRRHSRKFPLSQR